ncbi:hypothetical protein [Anaeroselena agilis]|uniref:Uncharacterized protein n=1 Tax=Anaeroselena agilis TaxID=3063788 RepID=A0ABU3NZC7_9FIRM|nr:hypothetical protein [Selenomonadales bacterium 4137-cl]
MNIADFTLEIGTLTTDTIPPFVQLAADTAAAYKEIDALYAAQSARCHAKAARSPYRGHPAFTRGGIDREIYAHKYLGLVLAAIEEGPDSPLFARVFGVMARRWAGLHRYITNSPEVFLDDVVDSKYHSPAARQAGDNLLAGAAGHYFDCFVNVYPVLDQPRQAALRFALFAACALGKAVNVRNRDILAEIELLSDQAPVTASFRDISRRLGTPEFKKVTRNLKNAIFQQARPDARLLWRNDRFIEGLAHCGAYLSAEEGVSLLSRDFLAAPKERDIELLCRLYFIKTTADLFRFGPFLQSREEVEKECAEFVMFGLVWLGLVREYKKTRRYYSSRNADYLRAELKALEEKLAASEESLRIANDALAAKDRLLALKDRQASELARQHRRETYALTKEIARLKGEAARDARLKALAAPAGAATPAAADAPEPPVAVPDTPNDLRKLKSVRAVVIGGTEKWQAKLSNHLPHFVYLYGDTTGFDEALVINADIVFADTRFKFSHGCFYRLADIVRRHNKKLVFLSRTNTALAVHQMAAAVD